MVNTGECLINVVTGHQAKDADRLEPKRQCGGQRLFCGLSHGQSTPPADRADLTHSVSYAKHGKPEFAGSAAESECNKRCWDCWKIPCIPNLSLPIGLNPEKEGGV